MTLDQIICGDNVAVLSTLPAECIDLTVTSPPYDNLREYGGHSWDFAVLAAQLARVTKPGGVVVWIVGDGHKDGAETLTSFRQALAFDALGLRMHDSMVYEKSGVAYPDSNRSLRTGRAPRRRDCSTSVCGRWRVLPASRRDAQKRFCLSWSCRARSDTATH